ncbi:hypothetical protein C8J57DRAFT_1730144 [Mycena rebaudengoi]|nr:hypothetical protein C8J57DRAFT_1730144 [Mycena rebaudengoi]
MSDHPMQPKTNWRGKLKEVWHKSTPKRGPAPPPPSSRSTIPAPSKKQRSSPDAAILPLLPAGAPGHVGGGGGSLGGAGTDTPDTTQSKPGSDLDINPYLKSTHTLSDPDWQAWNIDGDAISELRVWGAGHENSNWRKLTDTIDRSLKSGTLRAVQDFIPDNPVPAKTLVKALSSIVELGIRVPLIQKKVYELAEEAIRTVVEVVGQEPTANLKDLKVICTAVNDICKWAREHILKNTSSVDDLGDWKSKFESAKEMLSTVTIIKTRVEQVDARRKDEFQIHIQDVHGVTGGASGNGGTGGVGEGPAFHANWMYVENMHVEANRHKDFSKEMLANDVATKHEYTDQSKSLCAGGTRLKIQADIKRWLSPQPSNRERIKLVRPTSGPAQYLVYQKI